MGWLGEGSWKLREREREWERGQSSMNKEDRGLGTGMGMQSKFNGQRGPGIGNGMANVLVTVLATFKTTSGFIVYGLGTLGF